MSIRSFLLGGLICAGLLPFHASASVVYPAKVNIGKLQYGGGGDWYVNPSSLPNLLSALRQRFNLDSGDDHVVVKPDDPQIFQLPLVYFTGHGNIRFIDKERKNLRSYVERGGFIWADDNYGMDKSLRKEVESLFPESKLVEIPFDHAIYRSVYEFPSGVPKIHQHDGKRPQAMGVFLKGRLVFLYTYETDIGDGMEDPEVHETSPEKHEAAIRFGINVVVYALSH